MMKNFFLFGLLCAGMICFQSCSDDVDDGAYEVYDIATPLLMDRAAFEASVEVLPPRQIEESGKIYAYGDRVFINDKYQGVHIIDNQDPENPVRTGFINIPGNVDIAIRGNYLYADSASDLVVLDISALPEVREVNRLKDVFQDYMVWPAADYFDFSQDTQGKVMLGWQVREERFAPGEFERMMPNVMLAAEAGGDQATAGQGGSLARFKIVDTYLYTVNPHILNVFDLEVPEEPVQGEQVYAGFDIETIFHANGTLFLGSMQGMYIYSLANPGLPEFVSEFRHGTACDPVVVDGDIAYVTLRGGNGCGATESGLYLVDISNLQQPELLKMYPMEEPYGLGFRGNQLFICEGSKGLKTFDRTDPMALELTDVFTDHFAYDVIPLQEHLLLVGEGQLHQFAYAGFGLKWLSSIDLR